MTSSFQASQLEDLLEKRQYEMLENEVKRALQEDNVPEYIHYFELELLRVERNYAQIINRYNEINHLIKDEYYIAKTMNVVGTANYSLGRINEAYQLYSKVDAIFDQIGSNLEKGKIKNNLGIVYEITGDVKRAQEAYVQALDMKYKSGITKDDPSIISTKVNLGILYYQTGNLDQAKEMLYSTYHWYKTYSDTNSDFLVLGGVISAFFLLLLDLKEKNLESARNWHEIFKSVYNSSNEPIHKKYEMLANALILKASNRLYKRAKSAEIFDQILQEAEAYSDLEVTAIINLIELKLDEFKVLSDEAIIVEINDLIDTLIRVAEENNLYPKLVDGFILKAKFAEIMQKISESLEWYTKAFKLIEENGLSHLEQKVLDEREALNNRLNRIQSFIGNNKEIVDKLDKRGILDYLKKISEII